MNKKNYVFGLVLGLGTMIGCPTDDATGNDKVVSEKYQGKWVNQSEHFVLDEKTMKFSSGNTSSVYTEGNVLYSETGKLGRASALCMLTLYIVKNYDFSSEK
jgi:hypothetical protein